MKRNPDFRDPAPGTGVYEGDLKYGRCNHTIPKNGKDFTAERVDFSATNLPVFTLPRVIPRAADVWSGKSKHPKVKSNPPQLSDEIMVALVKYPNGLLNSLSDIRLGKTTIIKSKRARN